jgi:hypothetical protein
MENCNKNKINYNIEDKKTKKRGNKIINDTNNYKFYIDHSSNSYNSSKRSTQYEKEPGAIRKALYSLQNSQNSIVELESGISTPTHKRKRIPI